MWLLKNKPAGSVVIVDEAYHHFSDDESCIDQVAQDKDIIVMRTFSKIYGMAGLRAGFAVADLICLQKFNTVPGPSRSLASISITSAAAARASLQDKDLVSAAAQDQHGHPCGDARVSRRSMATRSFPARRRTCSWWT